MECSDERGNARAGACHRISGSSQRIPSLIPHRRGNKRSNFQISLYFIMSYLTCCFCFCLFLHFLQKNVVKYTCCHACYLARSVTFSRVIRDSTPRFVRPSIRPSVTDYFLRSLISLLLPVCYNDLKYGPANPLTTGVAVYLALFLFAYLHTGSHSSF